MEDASRHLPFLHFSHQVLAANKAADAIYHLQHKSGFNINLLLYAVWVARMQHGRLSKQQIKQLQSQIALWHQRVISELKYTHALLVHNDPLSLDLKKLLEEEIAKAYLIEQQMLYETHIKNALLNRQLPQQLNDACTSIAHYCELKNELMTHEDRIALAQLLSLAFKEINASDITQQVAALFERFDDQPKPTQKMLWE